LGYDLAEIPYLAIEVNNKIVDKRTKEEIKIESEFIEQLNHKSHIIQVRRLPENLKTKLEKFLVFFNQAWISQEDYILDLQNIPEEYAEIAKYLQQPLTDEEFVNNLKAEEEWEYNFTTIERKLYLAEQQKEEERRQKEEERRQKEEERRQKEETKLKLAQKMKKYGESIEDIMRETGLSKDEIEKL
jgi:hypothetical protein